VARPRLVFFGTADFSLPTLRTLASLDYHIVGVVTRPDARVGRSGQPVAPAVKQYAESQRLTVLQPKRPSDIIPELRALEPTHGILVSYGRLIPASILELVAGGIINVHASLLPRWRGASPIEAAILAGDRHTGVSLMQLEPGLDTGPVYAQHKIRLGGHETKPELYDRLAALGAELLVRELPGILSGTLTPVAQPETGATSCGLITKAAGQLDWTKPASVLEREIRAYLGWPGSSGLVAGRQVIVTAAHVGLGFTRLKPGEAIASGGELAVVTGDSLLVIDRLKPAGRREMTGREFVAGVPEFHR
jgi:methionyl-tRNA formyltransferase